MRAYSYESEYFVGIVISVHSFGGRVWLKDVGEDAGTECDFRLLDWRPASFGDGSVTLPKLPEPDKKRRLSPYVVSGDRFMCEVRYSRQICQHYIPRWTFLEDWEDIQFWAEEISSVTPLRRCR